jgi:hypothetical protein
MKVLYMQMGKNRKAKFLFMSFFFFFGVMNLVGIKC